MLDQTTIEQRLINLEKVVSELQNRFETKPPSDNWLNKLIGSISHEDSFLEALEYGRAIRQADKPIDQVAE